MNPRRRKRKFLKQLSTWVKTSNYSYVATYLSEDYSLGASLDRIIEEHKRLRPNASTPLDMVDKIKLPN